MLLRVKGFCLSWVPQYETKQAKSKYKQRLWIYIHPLFFQYSEWLQNIWTAICLLISQTKFGGFGPQQPKILRQSGATFNKLAVENWTLIERLTSLDSFLVQSTGGQRLK